MGKACLAMIASKEVPVIGRCLDSVKNLIDQICISVNGPEDGTREAIEEWGARNNIPTIVWYDKWKGYGPNKTRNLAKIRAELQTEYLIWLDADEVFVTNPHDPNSYLTPEDAVRFWNECDSKPHIDIFRMTTHYGGITYYRWQVARNNQVYIWHLPYQECLAGEVSNNTDTIDWVFNYSRKEGHSSRTPGVYDDGIRRLEKWMGQNEPTNPYYSRAIFYVGRAYFGSNVAKSINYLQQRLAMDGAMTGYYQEKYIAAIDIARMCGRKYNNPNPKMRQEVLLKAIEIDPSRLEAYYKLMRDANRSEQHRIAVGWAIRAPNNREVPKHAMFSKTRLYDYAFDFWMGVSAWWAANPAGSGYVDNYMYSLGFEASTRALVKAPEGNIKNQCATNVNLYRSKLESLQPKLEPPTLPVRLLDSVQIPARSDVGTSTGGIAGGGVSCGAERATTNSHKNTTLVVIDGFYDDPMAIRRMAMAMPFPVKGNYPGTRTAPFFLPGIKEKFEKILDAKITYWPTDNYNGSFQLTTGDMRSWIHRDKTDWSVVVFLTPDAPTDGGTKLYQHKATGLSRTMDVQSLEDLLNVDSRNEDAWHIVDRIGNKFGRAIMFRGRNSHMSDRYFGSSLEDGRLFQTFFFNTEA